MGLPATVTGPTNESTWTGAELLADLGRTPAPTIDAIFGHFDHTALETPAGDGVLADALATALPDGARLVFSMGCHSGLAVSDAVVGGGARRRRHPGCADRTRGRVRGGDGIRLRRPGQRRSAGAPDDPLRRRTRRLGLVGRRLAQCQAAVLRRARACTAPTTRRRCRARSCTACRCSRSAPSGRSDPTPPTETTTPVPGTLGLSSISYSEDFTFTARSGDTGRWYEADAGTGPQLPQITAGRPVQPRAETDVTAVATANSLLPAHGAVVSGLVTGDVVADFDAAFSRPTLDNAAGEPEPVNAVAAFPTRLAGVTTASDTQGPRRTRRHPTASTARADPRPVPVGHDRLARSGHPGPLRSDVG